MEPIDTFEHWGITVEIHHDDVAGDPYEDMDQASRLVWMEQEARTNSLRDVETVPSRSGAKVAQRYLTLFEGEAFALPFYYYDFGSSGQRAYLQAEPDDRTSGFVCVSREKVAEEWLEETTIDGETFSSLEMAERCGRDEFAMWKAWAEGNVYGFLIAGGDSCFGFYGDYDDAHLRSEARAAAEWAAFEREKRRLTERMYLLDPDAKPASLDWAQFRSEREEVATSC